MLKLKIGGNKHKLFNEFYEINLKKLKEAYDYLDGCDIYIKEYFRDREKNSVKQAYLLDFKIDWIAIFSDIDKEILKNVKVEGAADLSIDFLFGHVEKFIYPPTQYLEVKEFVCGGKLYKLIPETKTISGAAILFGEGTYNQWKLANMLSTQLSKDSSPSTVDNLVQLLAVLYVHDGDNSEKAIEYKINEFWEVDCLTAWSSYFFFVKLLSKWKSYFQSFTAKTVDRKVVRARKLILKEQSLRLLSKITFGVSLKLKWLNYNYLIMDWQE